MLPTISLNPVTREDVNRISRWLSDPEVSQRWFGHYGCGDPIHRGYEPSIMMASSNAFWKQLFESDHGRSIFSIYSDVDGHIGECQLMFDGMSGAEISLLIGRKEVWHQGYGTSALIELLDIVFKCHLLKRAWVRVPKENTAALGLFRKLGFTGTKDSPVCSPGEESPAIVLSISTTIYDGGSTDLDFPTLSQAVTVSGLPGSGSDVIAKQIARSNSFKLVRASDINEIAAKNLERTTGEIESLKNSHRSRFARWLREVAGNWEFSSGMVDTTDWVYADRYWVPTIHPYLTKEIYTTALKCVVRELVNETSIVLHGYGLHKVIPSTTSALKVYVTGSESWRVENIARTQSLSTDSARKKLKAMDKEEKFRSKSLFGTDITDVTDFDLTINHEKISLFTLSKLINLQNKEETEMETGGSGLLTK